MRRDIHTAARYESPRLLLLEEEVDGSVLFSSPMGGDGTEDSHSDDDGYGGEYEFDW